MPVEAYYAAHVDPTSHPHAGRISHRSYAREAQIYPHLSQEMVGRVAAYGREEWLPAGSLVFQRGERSVDLFVVLEGSIEIFERDNRGESKIITVHGARQFTGELD